MKTDEFLNMDPLIDTYNRLYDIKNKFPYKAIITDDLYTLRLSLCNDEDDVKKIRALKDKMNAYNGLLVEPDTVDKYFYILISRNYLKKVSQNTLQFENIRSKTFFHEYTHLTDYYEFKNTYKVDNMRDYQTYERFEPFLFYSEVRARFRSMYLYFYFESPSDEELLNGYEYLLSAYKELLAEPLNYIKMYLLAQFEGQYLAIQHKTDHALQIPQYINDYQKELMLEVIKYIEDISIFDHYEVIRSIYNRLYE